MSFLFQLALHVYYVLRQDICDRTPVWLNWTADSEFIFLFQVVLPVCYWEKGWSEVVWKCALDCSKTCHRPHTSFFIHFKYFCL